MEKKTSKSVSMSKRTRKWGLALLVAVTFVASAAFSGAVGAKDNPGAAATAGGPLGGGSPMAAVDAFIWFESTNGDRTQVFEIKDFSFGVENPTTIGSATGGAGAGKIKFNEFTIKKTTDKSSPAFFKACASGSHYQTVKLEMRKAGGDPKSAGQPFMAFTFDTVFTTKIDWSGPGDEGPEESITFVYGKLGVSYFQQNRDGTTNEIFAGWDQVTNKDWSQGQTD